MHVLSIGTGYKAQFLETNNDHDWGVLQWAPWLSEMMLYSAQLNATQVRLLTAQGVMDAWS